MFYFAYDRFNNIMFSSIMDYFLLTFQLYEKFEEFNRIHKHYKYKLPEVEILELTEAVCSNKETWERSVKYS